MRWRYILNIIGILTFFFGLTMIIPLLVGLYYHDQSVIPLLKSMGLTIAAGLSLSAAGDRGARHSALVGRT